jgi:hypothetical protein
MRLITKAMLALGGSLALVGVAAAAEQVHIMNVALPDGAVGQVRYVGNVPPRVVLVPIAAPVMPAMPVAVDDGFAQMERIAAAMDRQMATMMQQAATMAAQHPAAPGVQTVSTAPGGSYSYSYVSTTTSNGCTQTIETSSAGNNQPAKVVKTSSGDCKPAAAPAISAPKAKPGIPADTI